MSLQNGVRIFCTSLAYLSTVRLSLCNVDYDGSRGDVCVDKVEKRYFGLPLRLHRDHIANTLSENNQVQ